MTEEVKLEKPKTDRFAKARATLAAKRAAEKEAKEKLGLAEETQFEDEDTDVNAKFSMEEKVWLAGLTSAMRSREVKTAADVAICVPVADAVLKAFAEKFPE